ncbi:MAG: type II toxin-antitoxin system RelE/ParE family toxin [Bryobacterales bacterium]|nr:type II toxin-antitoxin system RelE/ParE family toxin [Bryobacterales bacterium]
MSWACKLTACAEEDLTALPRVIKKRVARVMVQMAADPFQGDVKALHGVEWKGVFRRRIGDYRILFTADRATETVIIHQISLRSGKTYR